MTQDSLSSGAINDSVLDFLKKGFNPLFKGKNWEAVLESIASAEEINWENARDIIWQLFISSAEGEYLDRRAFDEGYERPKDTGLVDELFRKLVIDLRAHKLTHQCFLDIVQLFYGPDYTQASQSCTLYSTYSLNDLDDLLILLDDEITVKVIFRTADFISISTATAFEVAAAITRALRAAGSRGFAIAKTIYPSGVAEQVVTVYSGKIGLRSSVQIVGGKANIALQFPTCIYPIALAPQWQITQGATPGRMVVAPTGVVRDFLWLQEGDLFYAYSNNLTFNNRGVFEVKKVFTTGTAFWFEIDNPTGTPQLFNTPTLNDATFFRPNKSTLYSNSQYALIAETDGKTTAILPSTTGAVSRTLADAGYLNGTSYHIESANRVGRELSVLFPRVLPMPPISVGDWVLLTDFNCTNTPPPVTPGSPSSDIVLSGTTDLSLKYTITDTLSVKGQLRKGINFEDGISVFLPGIDIGLGADLLHPWMIYKTSELINADGKQLGYTWVELPALNTGSFNYAYTKLKDGRIVVLGGTDQATGLLVDKVNVIGITVPTASVYDAGAGLGVTSYGDAVAIDNTVLLFGGTDVGGSPLDTITLIDPDLGTTVTDGHMLLPRMSHRVAALPDGSYLIIGGGYLTTLSTCERYTRGPSTSTEVAPMRYARQSFGLVTLPDGRVMVFGGTGRKANSGGGDSPLKYCEVYDPSTKTWNNLPNLPLPCSAPIAEYLPQTNEVIVVDPIGVFSLDLNTYRWSTRGGNCLLYAYGSKFTEDSIVWVGGTTGGGATPYAGKIYVGGVNAYKGGTANVIAKVKALIPNGFVCDTPEAMYGQFATGSVTLFKAGLSSVAAYIFDKANDASGVDGSLWLTDSVSGRVAVETLLEQYKESETQLDLKVGYPSDKGLGNAGYPNEDNYKLSDKVRVWGSNDIDNEVE